ncbi:hypothetical protein M434DRAFT_17771 [Hypoxylon sp. CO27-5]|nr:hypothetical protein M434DRAFT_17771 [Hypoxylon sp. CO27-5]
MPSSSTTRRISPSEWKIHKDRILELYIHQKLALLGDDGVIETMKKEGFTATKSQYETQLRVWEIRKYRTSKEWVGIISEIQQNQRRGGINDIHPLDRVMPPSRIERACRRHAPKTHQITESRPRDGDRVLSTPTESRHTSVGRIVPETVEMPPVESLGGAIDISALGGLDLFNFDEANPPGDDFAYSGFGAQDSDGIGFETSLLSSDDGGFGGTIDFSLGLAMGAVETSHIQSLAPVQRHITDLTLNTAATPIAYTFSSDPFISNPTNSTRRKQLTFPRSHWIQSLTSTEIAKMVLNSISSASILNSTYRSVFSTSRYHIIGQFITDVNKSTFLIMRRKFPKWKQPPNNVLSPQVCNNLLSEEIFVGEEQVRFDILSNDDAVECRFYTRLIRSMTNACSGLEGIPAFSVLRFLNRNHNIQSKFFQFLRSNSKYAAKSLAESTFQAAIEADDVNVAELLIELRLVDANETVCFYGAERRTPLEKAAIEQSLGILRLLLNRNVDINKSYAKKSHCVGKTHLCELRYSEMPIGETYSGGLECLIGSNYDTGLTLNENFLGLVDDFMKKGATIDMEVIFPMLRRFVDPRLARSIISGFVSQTPSRSVLPIDHLPEIVKIFDEEDAIIMIESSIAKSPPDYGNHRHTEFSRCPFNSALEEAVRRRSLKLVKILLPYSSPLHKAFEIAIKDKNQDIIDMILNEGRDSEDIASVGTLVAALTSGHQELIRFLEENGAFSRSIGNQLGKAITAAIEAGNLIFANKLLDCNPDFDGHTLEDTLRIAVAYGYDDFACKLLAAGADAVSRGGLGPSSALLVAMEKRKPQVVRAILEASNLNWLFSNAIHLMDRDDSCLALEAAIEYGDDTILNDTLKACSLVDYLRHIEGALELSFKRGGLDLFWKIIKLRRHDPYCLSAALKFAVGREDILLLDELFNLGASSDDEGALEKAVLGHPSMIEPLLKQFRQGHPRGRSRYGISALSTALERYPECAEGLNMLLAFKLIDVNGIDYTIGGAFTNRNFRIATKGKYRRQVTDDDIELVKKLLDAGWDPNIITSGRDSDAYYAQTTFLDAIETGSTKMVLLLLQYGAQVNEPASFGLKRTPLQKAVEVGSLEIVRLLLEKDADVNAPPAFRGGATALQLAAVEEHGARLDIPPPPGKNGRWPLEGAAENGRLDMIQLIWYANNRRLDKEQCRKAMRLAEYNGHIGCRDLIADLMSAVPAVSQGFEGNDDIDAFVNFDSC